MYAFRLRTAAVALAAGIGLSACATPFGSGLSVGLGNGGYYDPYYNGYGYGGGYPGYAYGYGAGYPGYGYGAGYPGYGYGYAPWGWYDNFYYPGSGYYVYDRYRNPYYWTDVQRRYWEARRDKALTVDAFRKAIESKKQNWDGFAAGPTATTATSDQVVTSDGKRVRVERTRPVRTERQRTQASQQTRVERTRPARVERSQTTRSERSSAWTERRSEIRAERASRAEAREDRRSQDQ